MPTPAADILAKIPVPTALDSKAIRETIPADIRRRAFFSARTASLAYLKRLQTVCAAVASGEISVADGRLAAIRVLRELGLGGEGPGLQDLASRRRLDLILKTQRQMAASVARAELQTPEVVELWPAWRLERYGSRQQPRKDWADRWRAAGSAVNWRGASRRQFVALKSSPIWQALGDGAGGYDDTLGNPYPPFAYGSGLDWTDVTREETVSLGLDPDEGNPAAASLTPGQLEIADAARRYGVSPGRLIPGTRDTLPPA